jgi:outer membrane receptor protein involved in Fe transport
MAQLARAGSRGPARIVFFTLAVALALSGLASAQAIRGTLLGTVTDAQGATVPGVTVTATETRTNAVRTAVTNQSGNFVFANLLDGLYRVETELSGFKKFSRDGIEVKVNSTMRVDVVLEVGAMTETVEVVQETPLLQTDRADTGRNIEGRLVQEMPLGQGRNFQGMWATVPGSVTLSRPHSQFFNPQDSQETKFNGQSRLSNNVQVDGLDNNHKTGLLTVLIPSAEAIDAVNVTTSNFDAEFGRAGGSVTTVVMKSGTNQWKGSVFAFANTESTQARNSFASATSVKPETKYQQFGATLGGPIVKDKLFFFTDYQHTVDNVGQLRRVVIPPAEWRNGDFSSASTKIYDPATGNADGTGRTQFPGNIIPANRLSPVAQSILAQIPLPNVPGAAFGQVNYELPSSEREKTTDAFNVKLNYNPGSSDQLSLRFSYQRPEIFVPGTFGELGGAGADFAGTGYQNTYSGALTWTRTLSQSLIMEWRAGYMKYHNEALSTGTGLDSSTQVGIPGANYDEFSSGISRITIGNGFTDPMVGFSNSLPWDRSEETVSVVGMLTKLTGNHTIKVGTEVRHNEDFLLQIQDAGGVRGNFQFNGARTSIPTDGAATSGIANSFAAFLLDAPSLVQRDIKALDRPGTKHWAVFAFVQDKWQVTPKLTVDLGLRWEYYTPLVGIEDQGGLSNYDPTNNTVQVAGYGSIPQNIGVESTWTNFAPRLGASYRFDEKTVLRAGFGTTIIPFPDNRYAYNFPVKQTEQFTAPNSFAPAGSMANGFGPPTVFPIPSSGVVDASIPQLRNAQLFYVPSDLKEAKLHSWNVAFQRQLPWNLVGEVAYVGNVGKDITVTDYNINAGMVLGAENAGRPFNQLYGRTANVQSWFRGDTNYHSLQAKLDRRFKNGFLLTTSYTLSRAENYSDEAGIATPADVERTFGPAGFNRTHAFASAFIWDLPFFKEGDGALHWILGGWQFSGIFTAYSGTPVNFTASAATLGAPGNTQFPNVSGEPEIIGDIGPGQKYFDTSAFSAPAQGTWGNLTRNGSISGPGFWNLDASLVKRLTFGQRVNVELRADAFNLTNTPHFNNPNGTFGQATFGEINSSFGQRLVRFGARVIF